MPFLDIFFLLLIVAFVAIGLKDGMIVAAGRIIGAVMGFVAAKLFYAKTAGFLAPFLPGTVVQAAAFILLFFAVIWLMGWVFKVLDRTYRFFAKIPGMKLASRIIGAFMGLIESIVFLGGSVWLIRTFTMIPFAIPSLEQSRVAVLLYQAFSIVMRPFV